jgi:hypothetical protein
MKATQQFNGVGLLGVILLLLGPVISGFGWLAINSGASIYSTIKPDLTTYYGFMFIGAIVSVVSLPFMIVGRTYTIQDSVFKSA